MAVRIGSVNNPSSITGGAGVDETTKKKGPTLQLNANSSFEAGSADSGAATGGLTLPTGLSEADREKMRAFFGDVTDAQMQQLLAAGKTFGQAVVAASPNGDIEPVVKTLASFGTQSFASTNATSATTGRSQAVSGAVSPSANIGNSQVVGTLGNAAAAYQSITGNTDAGVTAQGVTYMSLLGMESDLSNYAEKVQKRLNNKKQAQTELADVQNEISNWPDGQDTQTFQWTTWDNLGVATSHTENLTKEQAQDLQSRITNAITGFNDTNQMDQLYLQRLSNNLQQGVNTVSNLSKAAFETVKAVINNLRVG